MSQKGRGLPGRARAWAAALAILAFAAVSGGFAAGAGAVPGNFWGVAPQSTPTAEQFQRLKRGGVDSVRIPIEWGAVQANPGGGFNWNGDRRAGRRRRRGGDRSLPLRHRRAAWAVKSAVVNRAAHAMAPLNLPVKTAVQKTGWTTFLTEAVRRYGPNGAFWAANPAIPYRPIRIWQLWNEPNFKYFVARPNPAEYGKLVKLSTPVIRGIDPGAKIVLGGLFAAPKEATYKVKPPQAYFATDFIEQLYKKTPGIKSHVRRSRPSPLHLRLPGHRRSRRRTARRPQGGPAQDHYLVSLMGCQLETSPGVEPFQEIRAGTPSLVRLERGLFGGFKTKDLVLDLRVSEAVVEEWVRSGWLERKNGRITEDSLRYLCRHHSKRFHFKRSRPKRRTGSCFPWAMVAEKLFVAVVGRRNQISRATLPPDESVSVLEPFLKCRVGVGRPVFPLRTTGRPEFCDPFAPQMIPRRTAKDVQHGTFRHFGKRMGFDPGV